MEDQKIKEHADKHGVTDTHLHTHYSKKIDIIIVCQLPVYPKLSCTKVQTITKTLNQTHHNASQSKDGAALSSVKPA